MDVVTIYWILFLLGLGFAIISAVFSGFGHAAAGHDVDFSLDHDADLGGGINTADFGGADGAGGDLDLGSGDFFHGHGEIAMSPVSPMTIASFTGGFGGGGLIGHYIGLPVWGSLILGVIIGFLLGFGIYFIMYQLNKSNVSSEARASDALGITAELITPIVEDQVGEIAYILSGSRYTSPARSIDSRSIMKGRAVKIWRIVGSTCYVKEILPEEADQPSEDSPESPVL